MFFPNSRYASAGTYTVTRPDGTSVQATRLPLPVKLPLAGFHRRHEGQRLDLIASHYLSDATAFWQLCDATDSVIPDALAAAELVGVPVKRK